MVQYIYIASRFHMKEVQEDFNIFNSGTGENGF